jgi:hypothetical protein
MAHFAKVEEGVVTQVIVADSQQWCEANLGGTWVQTSYNTHGGVNSREGGENLRKNYAGIGYEFDGIGFYAPQPYPSWTKNADTYLWEAPVAYQQMTSVIHGMKKQHLGLKFQPSNKE